jgi:O-acetyl-ADP-ribose deacetylase (regulator of RNase III)
MAGASGVLKDTFQFGSTAVRIIQGDILRPGVDVDAVVSTDDNYLTMGSGVSRLLAERAGPHYVRAAQARCPVRAGTVVVTRAHQLPKHGLDVKYVLHGTVIDYDTEDLPLEQLVYQTTANCLEKAEGLGLRSILFPAFATGAGGLDMGECARRMCGAIKGYLAQERPLKQITIILYLPQASGPNAKRAGSETAPARVSELGALNRRFIREANLVLGVPYNPALDVHDTRDFFWRAAELQKLQAVITGQVEGRRHAVILGGPRVGKWALVDHFFHQAQQPGSAVGQGRRLVKVTFGRVHDNTPASFVYRKFLCALAQGEEDAEVRKEIRRAYADTRMDGDRFLKFLEDHAERYPQVVFLIDHLPWLLNMEAEDPQGFKDIRAFWGDLDRLEERVRFVYTARDDDQYQELLERLERFTVNFKDGIEVIELTCVTEQERQQWVHELFRRYLGRAASDLEDGFFREEAGRHPYLIGLTGHALIKALKPEALAHPTRDYDNLRTLAPFFQAARNATEEPRQAFFDLLMRTSLDGKDRSELSALAKAFQIESERAALIPDAIHGDPDAEKRLAELQAEGTPRQSLHRERLRRLESRGYVTGAADPATAQFMAPSFATWVAEYFGVDRRRGERGRSGEVVISLLGPEGGLSAEAG